ncbi:hypothetical protein NSQ26_05825 [Bacillus sp. FSL W7-1360]
MIDLWREKDFHKYWKVAKNALDRATYFELKVAGYSDELIRGMYCLKSRDMTMLRCAWGFDSEYTGAWMRKMECARAEEMRTITNKTG